MSKLSSNKNKEHVFNENLVKVNSTLSRYGIPSKLVSYGIEERVMIEHDRYYIAFRYEDGMLFLCVAHNEKIHKAIGEYESIACEQLKSVKFDLLKLFGQFGIDGIEYYQNKHFVELAFTKYFSENRKYSQFRKIFDKLEHKETDIEKYINKGELL
ncbi:hypothetical protein [Burkholderia cenocepacia]|uniref:hypothetical protein n=1 Tax=Burkholderia cenocepacia TaxID=95486 RepID=UPI0011776F1A|nr:hypothetical protein [Burkholderia cenocepacia]